MRISSIGTYRNTTPFKSINNNIILKSNSAEQNYNFTKSSYVNFAGIFNKKNKTAETSSIIEFKKDEDYGMNAYDNITSFKMADVLHRLDDENILVIGEPHIMTKVVVNRCLTGTDSDLQNPKNIKNVYLIKHKSTNPLIIQRTGEKTFLIYGRVANLTNPDERTLKEKKDGSSYYHYGNIASYDDVIESDDKLKLKFMKTAKEANAILYDAKYPVDSFLTDGPDIESGFVVNKTENSNKKIAYNGTQGTKYGQVIPHRTFDDIAGMDDNVDYMKKKLLYPLMYPNAFKEDKNHGIILYGPPGTGKTLLALATIGEVKKRQNKDVYFVKINSRDLEQRYVGVSEQKWRDVFEDLKNNQPAILFIDEIDALMVDRDNVSDSTHNSMTSQVSQLLQSIDDLEKTNARVWIIGATNRLEAIDPAIKRSGRLGDLKEVSRPDAKGCRAILDLYLKSKNVSEEFDRDAFAQKCYSYEYTGSDIAEIVNKARNQMYERCGIYHKMENGTYNDADLGNLQYTQADFDAAIQQK